jgi:NAD(P)-dependent dehydrogenase (short-subunit alcohol dehydrogenase family)
MKHTYNNIIITGSEGQIGSDLIKLLLKKNYNLILLDKKNKKDQNYFKVDISKSSSIKKTLKLIKKKYKKINGLINLAAVQIFSDFEKRSEKDLDLMLNVNIKANILLTKFVFNNYFKKQKHGKIINIGSIFGLISPDFNNYKKKDRKSSETYGASKAAIIQLTKYFANYMSNYNVRVNCISPGGIYNNQDTNFIENYSRKVPMNRMGYSDELLSSLEYLLSEKSSYVTGQNIAVDGGFTCW